MIQSQKKERHVGRSGKHGEIITSSYLNQTKKSTVLTAAADDSKNIARVVDENKRHTYIGNKAGQLFFTEKHIRERRKERGHRQHRWVQVPVRISFIALPCGNTTHLVEGSQKQDSEDCCSRISSFFCMDSEE